MAAEDKQIEYRYLVATEYKKIFRNYRPFSQLPPIERIGPLVGMALDDDYCESNREAVKAAINRNDWQALNQYRSWKTTEDNLSWYAVQCGGRIVCIVEVTDPYALVPGEILWLYMCPADQTEAISEAVQYWEPMIPAKPLGLFRRFFEWFRNT